MRKRFNKKQGDDIPDTTIVEDVAEATSPTGEADAGKADVVEPTAAAAEVVEEDASSTEADEVEANEEEQEEEDEEDEEEQEEECCYNSEDEYEEYNSSSVSLKVKMRGKTRLTVSSDDGYFTFSRDCMGDVTRGLVVGACAALAWSLSIALTHS